MGSGPKAPETDFKQLYQNYTTYLTDASARYEKSSGIARAKMAQSGIAENSAAWNQRLGELEKGFQDEMKEIEGGFTARTLQNEIQRRMQFYGQGAYERASQLDISAGDARKAANAILIGGGDVQSMEERAELQAQKSAYQLAADKPMMQAFEAKAQGKGWTDIIKGYFGSQFAAGKGEFGVKTKEEQAMERAKTAAGGGSSAPNASAAMMAQEETKRKTTNPWI